MCLIQRKQNFVVNLSISIDVYFGTIIDIYHDTLCNAKSQWHYYRCLTFYKKRQLKSFYNHQACMTKNRSITK